MAQKWTDMVSDQKLVGHLHHMTPMHLTLSMQAWVSDNRSNLMQKCQHCSNLLVLLDGIIMRINITNTYIWWVQHTLYWFLVLKICKFRRKIHFQIMVKSMGAMQVLRTAKYWCSSTNRSESCWCENILTPARVENGRYINSVITTQTRQRVV